MSKPWLPHRRTGATSLAPPLGHLLAGARARGVADGIAWLGLAAILIDDRGEAMHLNPAAVELMGEALFLESGRLRAADPVVDLALAEAVRAAIEDGAATVVRAATPESEVLIRIAAMPAADDDPFQLLRAVALLRASGKGRPARH